MHPSALSVTVAVGRRHGHGHGRRSDLIRHDETDEVMSTVVCPRRWPCCLARDAWTSAPMFARCVRLRRSVRALPSGTSKPCSGARTPIRQHDVRSLPSFVGDSWPGSLVGMSMSPRREPPFGGAPAPAPEGSDPPGRRRCGGGGVPPLGAMGAWTCESSSAEAEVPLDVLTGLPSPPASACWRRLAFAAMRKSPCVISPVVSAFFVVGARSFAVADAAMAAVSDCRAGREPGRPSFGLFSAGGRFPSAGGVCCALSADGELRPPIDILPLRAPRAACAPGRLKQTHTCAGTYATRFAQWGWRVRVRAGTAAGPRGRRIQPDLWC